MKKTGKETEARPSFLSTLATLLRLVWRLDAPYYAVLLLYALSRAAAAVLTISIPRLLIEGASLGWGWSEYGLALTVLLVARYLLLQLAAFGKRQEGIQQEKLQRLFPAHFAAKVMRLDYAQLEDPQVLDLKERALFPVTEFGALQQLLSSLMTLLSGLLTLVGVSVILIDFSGWFTLLVFVLTLISTLLNKSFLDTYKDVSQQLIPVNRRYNYYVEKATRPDFQKEFRLFGLNQLMDHKIRGYTAEIRSWLQRVYVSLANVRSLQALVAALIRFLTLGLAALRVQTSHYGPQLGLGSFAVVVAASESFVRSFAETAEAILYFSMSIGFLEPFCSFLDLPESRQTAGDLQPGPLQTLTFDQVSFTYPGSDRPVLEDLSFSLRRGESVSLVGLNNAGKSTVVKLICRFFTPDAGRILWNGVDIRELDHESYLQALSCVFQDYQLFPFSLGENLDPARSDQEIAQNPASLQQVLAEVGLSAALADLPRGLQTRLDKSLYEDASELSGGQKQKLAIARALHKEAQLIILDEPTAALDPLAEAEVYEHFYRLTAGRTALFISHRMSSSTFCDRVLLLQEGRAAAFDSHQRLMQSDNLYRELFETQAQHYRS